MIALQPVPPGVELIFTAGSRVHSPLPAKLDAGGGSPKLPHQGGYTGWSVFFRHEVGCRCRRHRLRHELLHGFDLPKVPGMMFWGSPGAHSLFSTGERAGSLQAGAVQPLFAGSLGLRRQLRFCGYQRPRLPFSRVVASERVGECVKHGLAPALLSLGCRVACRYGMLILVRNAYPRQPHPKLFCKRLVTTSSAAEPARPRCTRSSCTQPTERRACAITVSAGDRPCMYTSHITS